MPAMAGGWYNGQSMERRAGYTGSGYTFRYRGGGYAMLLKEKGQRRRLVHWLAGVFFTVFCAFFAASLCFSAIQAELKEHIAQSLADVTRQYAIAVQTELRAKFNLLQGVSMRMPQDLEGIQRDLDQFSSMQELYHFKRVGYLTLDGVAYGSDGVVTDITHDPFWETVSQGKRALSYVMDDSAEGSEVMINVFTYPLYQEDGTTLRGYLFASYPASVIRDLVSIDSFGGEGSSYILLPSGDVVSGPQEVREQGNVFDLLQTNGEENEEVLAQMQADFASGGTRLITYDTGEANYMYYMPVSAMNGDVQLYLATIVPVQVMNDRTEAVLRISQFLILFVLLSIFAFLAVAGLSYYAQHRELKMLAYVDPMTGGDNYTVFRLKMRSKDVPGHIVSVDLSEFKIVNNVCGVKKGDELIQEMWKVLAAMLRKEDLGCHISGDRYVLFLREPELSAVIQRILQCNQTLCHLSVLLDIPQIVPKFGIYPTEHSAMPEDGYGKANLAKKTIASRRDRCYAVYDEELQQHLIREKWMEDAFESALAEREFEIWYQPKYDPAENRIVGGEALCRWRRPSGEMYLPGAFIPLFERNGMIARLDEYMFRRVCAAQRTWMDAGWDPVPVSVNISRTSLYYPGIVERYLQIVQEAGIDKALVPLEITESAMIDNQDAEERIYKLRDAGFQIQIDDFGRGYSSLSALSLKCFSGVKLDKSLIDCVGDSHGEFLLDHVIRLAHGLGMSITAEGVEQQAQVKLLMKLKCDEIQGYYFSRPQPQEEFEKKLKSRRIQNV